MNKYSDGKKLRRSAEAELEASVDKHTDLSESSPQDMHRLIHELQVHQIELKMQNDELRRIAIDLERVRDKFTHLYDFAPVGYFAVNTSAIIEEVNLKGADMLGVERGALTGTPFTRFIQRDDQDIFYMLRQHLLQTETPDTCELRILKRDGTEVYVHLECIIRKSDRNDTRQIRMAVSDITEQKRVEKERDKLILNLQNALDTVKQLSGMLPICVHCKNIRDDEGYWNKIEAYIRDHSEAEFTHSICPVCVKKLYPNFHCSDD